MNEGEQCIGIHLGKEPMYMSEDEQQTADPLDLATEVLFNALKNAKEWTNDLRQNETTRTLLMVAQTTALIDIARSMRVQTTVLDDFARSMRRA